MTQTLNLLRTWKICVLTYCPMRTMVHEICNKAHDTIQKRL
jgi:hypothetical protein